MKYFFLIYSILIIAYTNSFSLSYKDSINHQLNNYTDIKKVNYLIDLTEQYYIRNDTLRGKYSADMAFRISYSLNNKVKIIDSYNNYTLLYSFINKSISIKYNTLALDLCKSFSYPNGESMALFLAGNLSNQNNISFEYYQKSYSLAKKINSNYLMAINQMQIGELYRNNGLYQEALKYFLLSQSNFFKYINNESSNLILYYFSSLQNSLGIVYKNLNNFNEAYKYNNKYLSLSIKLKENWGIAIAFNNFGNIFSNQSKYDSALYYYKEASIIFNKIGNNLFIIQNNINIGNLYSSLKKYNTALSYYKIASNIIYNELKDSASINLDILNNNVIVNINIAELYIKTKKYSKAISKYNTSLVLSNKTNNYFHRMSIYYGLYKTYLLLNNSKNALYYHTMYSNMKDTLFNQDKAQEIGSIKSNFEFEKKIYEQRLLDERTALQQAEQNRRTNNLQYSGILIFIIFLFILAFLTGKFKLKIRLAEGIIFITFILLFEFILLIINPTTDAFTNDIPIFKLGINVVLAIIIFPLHSYFEETLKRKIKK